MRLLSVLLLFSVCSLSQPQPERSQPKGGSTESQQTNSNRSEPPAINQRPAENVGTDAQNHKSEKVDNEQRIATFTEKLAKYTETLARYTLAVAIFTAVLVVVGLLQFGALIRQATALRHHSDLIDQSVREMRNAVAAYERYVEIGERALALTRDSNTNARAATELTRQSLILTQRPKLIVRNVALDQEDIILRWNTVPGGGGKDFVEATGTLHIVNVGGSTAHIVSMSCNVVLLTVLPMRSPLSFDPVASAVSEPIAVPPGKYGTMSFPRGMRQDSISFKDLLKVVDNEVGVFVIGEIIYRDDLGNVRATSFCREWRSGYTRFRPVDNPDYEHAE